ncbi:MAG: hypothetical protein E6I91_12725 [Chloroflexi bacterium]|nr:MAG: hypothetical protein E6I91_12725 [Chloroflexota bacterium]
MEHSRVQGYDTEVSTGLRPTKQDENTRRLGAALHLLLERDVSELGTQEATKRAWALLARHPSGC